MWMRTYSQTFQNVTKEAIWELWTDINQWPTWHNDLYFCTFDGPFEVGNYFMLKPKGMRAVKIILTEIEKGHKFTDCTSFFGAKMYDTHELEETSKGHLKLTNTLKVTGPLKWLWIKFVAQNVANTVPEEMEALVNLARKKYP
ncbi:MAG: polyketide cyclase [Proteobacteria bacterium]|nr:polyketide cyclase [Pseudomonadota bacterium]